MYVWRRVVGDGVGGWGVGLGLKIYGANLQLASGVTPLPDTFLIK